MKLVFDNWEEDVVILEEEEELEVKKESIIHTKITSVLDKIVPKLSNTFTKDISPLMKTVLVTFLILLAFIAILVLSGILFSFYSFLLNYVQFLPVLNYFVFFIVVGILVMSLVYKKIKEWKERLPKKSKEKVSEVIEYAKRMIELD